ncbi:hypothetical protein [Streptomyces sp. AC495_CC817]|uniref:plasmid mobilization protein n=1 Tax=Streptomyces sp. AC495_CC817 TaxID=2823900 RepID=UPI0035A93BD0
MTRDYGFARTENINLCLSAGEKRQIRENAAWFGMEVAEYLRYAALGGTIEAPALRRRAHRRGGSA